MTPRDPLPAADAGFDQRARALYRESLEQLPAGVHARLRRARNEALATRRGRLARWLPAGVAATAVLAVAALAGLQPESARPPEAPLVQAAPAEPGSAAPLALSDPELALVLESLDHNPDFYLWLASSDVATPER